MNCMGGGALFVIHIGQIIGHPNAEKHSSTYIGAYRMCQNLRNLSFLARTSKPPRLKFPLPIFIVSRQSFTTGQWSLSSLNSASASLNFRDASAVSNLNLSFIRTISSCLHVSTILHFSPVTVPPRYVERNTHRGWFCHALDIPDGKHQSVDKVVWTNQGEDNIHPFLCLKCTIRWRGTGP